LLPSFRRETDGRDENDSLDDSIVGLSPSIGIGGAGEVDRGDTPGTGVLGGIGVLVGSAIAQDTTARSRSHSSERVNGTKDTATTEHISRDRREEIRSQHITITPRDDTPVLNIIHHGEPWFSLSV
jgi:hypothetical protein